MKLELTVQELCNWFEDHKHKSILIEKQEQDDLDKVELEVQEVGLLDQAVTDDDYIPSYAVVLRGMGTIQNRDGEMVRLPQDYYEIPLDGHYEGTVESGKLELQTERAHYSIQLH